MGASAGVKAGLVKAAGQLASATGGPEGMIFGQLTNLITSGTNDEETLLGINVNSEADYSLAKFAKSAAQAESAQKIAEKKTTNKEITVGGLPNEDWRAWATSVKSKPMPIKYE
jgi:hypothetical protein